MSDKKPILCSFCKKKAEFKLIGFPTTYSCKEHRDKLSKTRTGHTPVEIKEKP